MDRYAITAELHRRGTSHAQIARRLGVTPTMVGYVVANKQAVPYIRRAIARALGKPQTDVWPDAKPARRAA